MRQLLKKRLKNQKGLTLIELLAVIVILAIVAAIAIPAIGNIIENSRLNGVKSDAINVLNAANVYLSDNPEPEDDKGTKLSEITVKMLKDGKYLDTAGKIPDDATITVNLPRKLSAKDITYSGSKKVTFNGATIEDINNYTTKGSADGNKTIGNGN